MFGISTWKLIVCRKPIILEIVFRWFSFFGSSQAHLEPELELFEVDDIGDDGDDEWWFVAPLSPKRQTALARVLDDLERKKKKII